MLRLTITHNTNIHECHGSLGQDTESAVIQIWWGEQGEQGKWNSESGGKRLPA